MITWNCRNTINLGRSFSTSGLRAITNSSPTGIVYDRMNTCDHRIFLTILQPRSIPKVVFVPITTTNFERLVHSEKTLFFSWTHSKFRLACSLLTHMLVHGFCTLFKGVFFNQFSLENLRTTWHVASQKPATFPLVKTVSHIPQGVRFFSTRIGQGECFLNLKWCVIFSLIQELENRDHGRGKFGH